MLPTCVKSLLQDPAVDRVIVVNNSPGDGARAAVEAIDGITYLESEANIGFGCAVNRASCLVRKEFVAIVNPDAFQFGNTVTAAIMFLKERPSAGLVGPRLLSPDGSISCSSKRATTLVRMIAERLGGPSRLRLSRPPSDHEVPHETPYVIGSFVVCRRAALDAVGWFDESIFLFGEDHDLCQRLLRGGWQVWYAPLGAVEHLSGHSWHQLSDQGRKAFREARVRELMAERGAVETAIYRALCSAADGMVALRQGVRRLVGFDGS